MTEEENITDRIARIENAYAQGYISFGRYEELLRSMNVRVPSPEEDLAERIEEFNVENARKGIIGLNVATSLKGRIVRWIFNNSIFNGSYCPDRDSYILKDDLNNERYVVRFVGGHYLQVIIFKSYEKNDARSIFCPMDPNRVVSTFIIDARYDNLINSWNRIVDNYWREQMFEVDKTASISLIEDTIINDDPNWERHHSFVLQINIEKTTCPISLMTAKSALKDE